MREQITMYRDMYEFYKDTKSKKLLVAFIEYLFEGIEPTDLKGIEKTIFFSLKIRMENQRKNAEKGSRGGKNSRGGGRPRNTSSELKEKTSQKQAEKQANKQAEKQAENKEDNNTNVLLLSNILSKDNIYSNYYGKTKGIDEKVCNKLIDDKLKQGSTLDTIYKCMVLYGCDCSLNTERKFVKKFETWITEFQPLDEEQMDMELRRIARDYKQKSNNNPKFQNSKSAKTIRVSLCDAFGEQKVREIWKTEGKKEISLNLR